MLKKIRAPFKKMNYSKGNVKQLPLKPVYKAIGSAIVLESVLPYMRR